MPSSPAKVRENGQHLHAVCTVRVLLMLTYPQCCDARAQTGERAQHGRAGTTAADVQPLDAGRQPQRCH